MIREKTLTKYEASRLYQNLQQNDFSFNESEMDNEYTLLREKLFYEYNKITNEYNSQYQIDLNFGIYLYSLFNEKFELHKNTILSSDLEFWYYISIVLIPDIVYKRWGDTKSRFYDSSNRVWVYTLWWYIHLSWQGSFEATYNTIKNYSTDTIVQLIERVGEGFEIRLTRELMKQLNYHVEKTQLFRRVMVLNTAYLQTIEPNFYEGSVEGYVSMLFEKAK